VRCGEYSNDRRKQFPLLGDLRDLVLQRAILDVVAHAAGKIQAFAIKTHVADQRANLVESG